MTSPHVQEELARYALGEMHGDERSRVEEHLGLCAECRHDLNATRLALGLMAMAEVQRVTPSPRIRARLLKKIQAERERPSYAWKQWLAWAAVAVVIGFLGWENYSLRSHLHSVEQRLATTDSKSESLRALLLAPDSMRVTLRPASAAPQPQGRAVYVAHDSRLLFFGNDLESLPAGKAYELWLLPFEGKPVPAGLFKPDARGEAMLLNPPLPAGLQAKGFAITVEPETGSAQPSSAILLAGTI